MREICPRCRWPKEHCWCRMLEPMGSDTKFVILMHPHESRHIKNGTGRFAALSFRDAELLVGLDWEHHPRMRELLSDPRYKPMLLYPGKDARNLSEGGLTEADLGGRRLLVFVLDATWKLARAMFNQNPVLQRLDRIMFTPSFRSRFVIKRQPADFCLSTLEAVHELMVQLDAAGLDRYERPSQLVDVFMAMQEFQLACMRDEGRGRYRPGVATRGERLSVQAVRAPRGIVGGGMGPRDAIPRAADAPPRDDDLPPAEKKAPPAEDETGPAAP